MNRLTELESLDISGTNLGGSDGDKVVTGKVEVQAVEGDHVVQVTPVVVKTYKLYIHNIQFCTEYIVIRSGDFPEVHPGDILEIYHEKKHSPDFYYRSNKKVSILKIIYKRQFPKKLFI